MFNYIKNKIKCFLLRNKVKTGKGVNISNTIFEGRNTLFEKVNIANSKVGFGSYIQKRSNILSCSIGRYCSIADNVYTCLGTHPTNFISTYPAFYYDTTCELGYSYYIGNPVFKVLRFPDKKFDYQIKIGNDVWIGSNVLIMGGVTVGDGAIIAAGSVVTKSVPSYQVWGGVPAKFIRNRFSDDLIAELQEIQWWNQPEEWVRANSIFFTEELTISIVEKLKRTIYV